MHTPSGTPVDVPGSEQNGKSAGTANWSKTVKADPPGGTPHRNVRRVRRVRICRRSAVELFARGSIAALAIASEDSPTTTVLALADASRLTTAMVPQSNSSPAGTAHYTDYGSEDLSKTAHVASAGGGNDVVWQPNFDAVEQESPVEPPKKVAKFKKESTGKTARMLEEAGSQQVAFFGREPAQENVHARHRLLGLHRGLASESSPPRLSEEDDGEARSLLGLSRLAQRAEAKLDGI